MQVKRDWCRRNVRRVRLQILFIVSDSINGYPLLLQKDIAIVPLNMPRPPLFKSLCIDHSCFQNRLCHVYL